MYTSVQLEPNWFSVYLARQACTSLPSQIGGWISLAQNTFDLASLYKLARPNIRWTNLVQAVQMCTSCVHMRIHVLFVFMYTYVYLPICTRIFIHYIYIHETVCGMCQTYYAHMCLIWFNHKSMETSLRKQLQSFWTIRHSTTWLFVVVVVVVVLVAVATTYHEYYH